MDKISGIVASSPRVTAVDMRESSPVRPGVPAFGRAEGVSSLKDAAALQANMPSSLPKAAAASKEVVQWKSKDAEHADLVTKLSDSFFGKNQRTMEKAPMPSPEAEKPAASMMMRDSMSTPAGFKTDGVGSLRAAAASPRSMAASIMDDEFDNDEISAAKAPKLAQPEGLFPKGSFLDRAA